MAVIFAAFAHPGYAVEGDTGAVLDRPPGAAVPDGRAPQGDMRGRDAMTVMFDNFFISLVVARRCGAPDEATMQKFATNLLIVQQLTLAHYREHLPSLSEEELLGIMNSRAEALDVTIQNQISQKQCDHDDIQQFIKMFDMHANMDLLPDR